MGARGSVSSPLVPYPPIPPRTHTSAGVLLRRRPRLPDGARSGRRRRRPRSAGRGRPAGGRTPRGMVEAVGEGGWAALSVVMVGSIGMGEGMGAGLS